MNPQVKPAAEVLMIPVIGSNLNPEYMPIAQPEPKGTETVKNDYTVAAHKCAEGILKASQSRYSAWAMFAESVSHADGLNDARKALQTELQSLGYARYQVEASEWLSFALVYHFDKASALHIVDPERREKTRDSKGNVVVVNGEEQTHRPTADQIIKDLRSTRDLLAKSDKIPVTIYKPKSAPKAPTNHAAKISAVQFDAVCKNIQAASAEQFASLWLRFLDHASHRGDAKEFLSAMKKGITAAQIKAGFIKPAGKTLVHQG